MQSEKPTTTQTPTTLRGTSAVRDEAIYKSMQTKEPAMTEKATQKPTRPPSLQQDSARKILKFK